MKKKTYKIWGVAALVLLIGSITLLLYPSVSKVINQKAANSIIERFNEVVERVDQESSSGDHNQEQDSGIEGNKSHDVDYIVYNSEYTLTPTDIEALHRDSLEYNEGLKEYQSFDDTDFSSAALDLTDYGIHNGVYGYISIPAVNMQMPILLGSSDENMASGVTHLFSTSLPTGGTDTNCVISGHTGYTGKTFFDDIPGLPIGSRVTVRTLFGELEYQVKDIKKIEINQTADLYIQKSKDMLTLLTCADGGQKRWLVSCVRDTG